MSVRAFYDALAPWYHLVYQDWEASITRQGEALRSLLATEWGPVSAGVLDAAIGIGTQALGLARLGYRIVGSDISPAAVHRAQHEARCRGLHMACHVADVRALAVRSSSVDAVLACDNALSHLLSEDEIRVALKECFRCLRPRGGCVISIRDYGLAPVPGTVEVKDYGDRAWLGRRCRLRQICRWRGPLYDLAFELVTTDGIEQIVAGTPETTYFAIVPTRMAALMEGVGFTNVRRIDGCLFQPVLVGTR